MFSFCLEAFFQRFSAMFWFFVIGGGFPKDFGSRLNETWVLRGYYGNCFDQNHDLPCCADLWIRRPSVCDQRRRGFKPWWVSYVSYTGLLLASHGLIKALTEAPGKGRRGWPLHRKVPWRSSIVMGPQSILKEFKDTLELPVSLREALRWVFTGSVVQGVTWFSGCSKGLPRLRSPSRVAAILSKVFRRFSNFNKGLQRP